MPPQLVAEQGPSSSGNLSTFITIHSVKRTMSSPPRLLPYLHLVPDLGKLSPTGDWHMCCLVGWRGSSEMFLTELGVRPCPAADRSSQGLQKWLTVYDDLNGQITATHFHSNHSLWNSDMRTPRITALSLKKKKEWVGMFWIFPPTYQTMTTQWAHMTQGQPQGQRAMSALGMGFTFPPGVNTKFSCGQLHSECESSNRA